MSNHHHHDMKQHQQLAQPGRPEMPTLSSLATNNEAGRLALEKLYDNWRYPCTAHEDTVWYECPCNKSFQHYQACGRHPRVIWINCKDCLGELALPKGVHYLDDKRARNIARPANMAAPYFGGPGMIQPATTAHLGYPAPPMNPVANQAVDSSRSQGQAQPGRIHLQADSGRQILQAATPDQLYRDSQRASERWAGNRGLFGRGNYQAAALPSFQQPPSSLSIQPAHVANNKDKSFVKELALKKCQFGTEELAGAGYLEPFTNEEINDMKQLMSLPDIPYRPQFANPDTMSEEEAKRALHSYSPICDTETDDVDFVKDNQEKFVKALMNMFRRGYGFQVDYIGAQPSTDNTGKSHSDLQARWDDHHTEQQSNLANKIETIKKDQSRYVEAICRNLVFRLIRAHKAGVVKTGKKKVAGRPEVMQCSTRIYYIIRALHNIPRMRYLLFMGDFKELIRAPLKSMLSRLQNLWSNDNRPKRPKVATNAKPAKRKDANVSGDGEQAGGQEIAEHQPRSLKKVKTSSNQATVGTVAPVTDTAVVTSTTPEMLSYGQSHPTNNPGMLPYYGQPNSGYDPGLLQMNSSYTQQFDAAASADQPGTYISGDDWQGLDKIDEWIKGHKQ